MEKIGTQMHEAMEAHVRAEAPPEGLGGTDITPAELLGAMESVPAGAGPEAVAAAMMRPLAEVTAAFMAHMAALTKTMEALKGGNRPPQVVPNRADRRRGNVRRKTWPPR